MSKLELQLLTSIYSGNDVARFTEPGRRSLGQGITEKPPERAIAYRSHVYWRYLWKVRKTQFTQATLDVRVITEDKVLSEKSGSLVAVPRGSEGNCRGEGQPKSVRAICASAQALWRRESLTEVTDTTTRGCTSRVTRTSWFGNC